MSHFQFDLFGGVKHIKDDKPINPYEKYFSLNNDQAGRCFWCLRVLSKYEEIHGDHVIPKSKFKYEIFNPSWVVTCKKCNLSKGAQDPLIWWLNRLMNYDVLISNGDLGVVSIPVSAWDLYFCDVITKYIKSENAPNKLKSHIKKFNMQIGLGLCMLFRFNTYYAEDDSKEFAKHMWVEFQKACLLYT